MKLHSCLVMGKFCGLNTVDECIENIRLHWHAFTEEDLKELNDEINLFMAGNLEINWDAVNADVKKQEEEYDEYCRNNPPVMD